MIVTLTPNPSIDRTVHVARLERGDLNRVSAGTSEAAGKGLNVSRALRVHGVETTAVLPLAAETATAYLTLLDDAVPITPVPIAGSMRTNLTIAEPDGTITKVNEPGPPLAEADADALIAVVDAIPCEWIVGCGSLPPSAPADLYARLARLASPTRRIAVDTSGDALRAAAAAGPDLLKPNLAELEELAGRRVATLGDVVTAARGLISRGVRAVLVSLGADGAVYVDRHRVARAVARVGDVANTVGAGDALLAGYLAAGGGPGALRAAVAWSVAAVRSTTTWTRRVRDEDLAAVFVDTEIDASRLLGCAPAGARTK